MKKHVMVEEDACLFSSCVQQMRNQKRSAYYV